MTMPLVAAPSEASSGPWRLSHQNTLIRAIQWSTTTTMLPNPHAASAKTAVSSGSVGQKAIKGYL
jgi:hypothetical protein